MVLHFIGACSQVQAGVESQRHHLQSMPTELVQPWPGDVITAGSTVDVLVSSHVARLALPDHTGNVDACGLPATMKARIVLCYFLLFVLFLYGYSAVYTSTP